jgi:hypothetical protein
MPPLSAVLALTDRATSVPFTAVLNGHERTITDNARATSTWGGSLPLQVTAAPDLALGAGGRVGAVRVMEVAVDLQEVTVTKRRPMTDELHIGEVEDDELTMVLTSVLPRGAQFRPDEVEYRTMSDEWALSLQYREGKIIGAVAGPVMTPELEEQIRTEIERILLTPTAHSVCRWTLFSSRPVQGYWRYRDQFQIVPAPPHAPRPTELIAEHPFILDFLFADSVDGRIRQHRYIRRASDLTLVLNLLLRPRITSPSNRPKKHWVCVWPPEVSAPDFVWASEGYMIPNFRYIVDDFPATADSPPLGEVTAETYYDFMEGYADTLTIPAELARLLDAFNGLNGDDRERFLRACYWYQTASTVWDYSQSLYLTSLVNAIECLSSIGPERSRPEGPSALFLSFMKRFAPGKPGGNRLNKIYDTRGEITHGERLLYLDQSSRVAGLDETSARDREVGEIATMLCRGALINWLWSHHPVSTGPMLTKGLPTPKRARPGTKSNVVVIIPPKS